MRALSSRLITLLTPALGASLVGALAPSTALAQGWILPPVCPPCPRPRICAPCVPNRPTVIRTSSDIKAELADRVLRYEITETFVNRGAGLGEADYLFPLPK